MNDFEVMNKMSGDNMDIACFPTVTDANKVRGGFKISMGVPEAVGYQIAAEMATGVTTHYLMLYRVNKEQFDKIKAGLTDQQLKQ